MNDQTVFNLARRDVVLGAAGVVAMVAGWPLAAAAQDKPRVVAFAQDTLKNDFRLAQVNEVKEAVAKLPGWRFVNSDAQGQTSLLIHQIEQFAAQQVDVLIVGTNDERAVVPAVAKAFKAGIHVIVLDRGIQGKDYTTFINSDNVLIGKLGGEYIAQRLGGKGKVLLFEGLQTADVTHLRTKGFMDEMRKHKGIRVIKRTGNYLRKDALLEMERLLASGERVDAIFAESDSMLSGARMALVAAQVDVRKLITVGCDYTSEARDAIRDGTQTASVLFPLGGHASVDAARKLVAGEKVAQHIVIPVKLVTRDNVEHVTPVF
jgi:ribose transport system substrate-binding protein